MRRSLCAARSTGGANVFMRALGRPPIQRGALSTGRIVKLFVGQGYGFVRLVDDREIFFHRSDVREGMSINDLAIGDAVAFELFEDSISGARALQLRPDRRQR